ncbi:MAG: ABC transporter substrate-binding protein [Thermoplasmata archaeon]
MEKKTRNAIIAIIVVLVVVVAAFAAIVLWPTTAPSVSVSASTQLAPVGTPITFTAIIPSSISSSVTGVNWNFGDGTTGNGTTVTHTYNTPGNYLVFLTVTEKSGYLNNLGSLFTLTITSPTITNSVYAGEITQPVLTVNTTLNPSAPIFSVNEKAYFVGSYLQPPTMPNWSLAYYIFNFGDGSQNVFPVYYNNSSGAFLPVNVTHQYSSPGFYVLNFTIVTYNITEFETHIVNVSKTLQYLPLTYFNSVLASPQHHVVSTLKTIYVSTSTQKASVLKGPGNVPNPNVIQVVEVVPAGPYSFDPQIDYETVGYEIIANVYETLIAYNGSSTSQFVPIVAKEVPSLSNGLISPNGLNYTFYIRPNLTFANGDPLTVYDVYMSFVRALLFVQGSPGTADWIIAQDLLPGGGFLPGLYTNGTALYQNITRAITYNNQTQSITFHLLKPDPAFLYYVADALGSGIVDYKWLAAHGANITMTPSGFLYYTRFGNEINYNNYIRYNAMGSGPYMIQSYLSGQSIVLIPNPNFKPIPGVPGYDKIPTLKVYIQWVKDYETALLMMESGQSDITTGLPTSDYPTVAALQAQGKQNIYTFPTLSINFYNFVWNVNTSLMQKIYGSQYHIPYNYFANPLVRKAFAYAFNYTNYIDNILGNKIYHANFGFHYTGIIPEGMPGYIPPDKLQNVPVYNLTLAKKFMMESGMYNVSINIPIIVYASDPVDFAAASMWASNLSKMDPNIQATPIYQPFATTIGYMVPGENPMPIYLLGWAPDYPYPSDYVNAMYLENGTYPGANGWNYTNLMSWGYKQEAQEWKNMTDLILKADSTSNVTLSLQYFDQAEQIAVNLTLYVYTLQQNGFWYYAPWIHGVEWEENPMIGGGGDTLYFYLTKG